MKNKRLVACACSVAMILAGSVVVNAGYNPGNSFISDGILMDEDAPSGEGAEPAETGNAEQPETAAPANSEETPGETPTSETPASEQPTESVTEGPTENPSSENITQENTTENTTEQPGTDQQTTEQQSTEQQSTEQQNTEQGSTEEVIAIPSENEEKKEEENNGQITIEVKTQTTDSGMLIYDMQSILALKQQLESTRKDKIEIQQLISNLMTEQNGFIEALHELDKNIIEYEDRLAALEQEKTIARNTVTVLNAQLLEAEEEEKAQYEMLKEHIRQDYENGRYGILDALTNAVDFTSITNQLEYIQAVEAYDQRLMNDLVEKRRNIANKKLMLETLDEDIALLEDTYDKEEENLVALSNAKVEEINKYQAKIDEASEALSTIEQLEKKMDTQMFQLELEYRQKLQLSSARTITYDGGKFAWPMPSGHTITSPFGMRNSPTAGASANHRGIDIACSMGSPCIAPAPGTIIYTGYMGTGGMCVMIDHGSGVTSIYYHLSSYCCQPGDNVNTGDVVALSGNTGVTTGPHLHFAVRINGEYYDPMQFF